jgi:hypothetical protein
MKPWFWFMLMLSAALLMLSIVMLAQPGVTIAKSIHPCGENAGWIEAQPGYIACTLKNGRKKGVLLSLGSRP